MAGKILVVSGHTDLKNNSFANKIILDHINIEEKYGEMYYDRAAE